MADDSLMRRTSKNVLSGTMAGISGVLVGHPFDTLKVRLQTQPVHNPVYNGLTDCFVKTMKWEGIGGLYKGVGSPLVGQMFFRAVLFTSYYQITNMFSEKYGRKRLHRHQYFICGAYTGLLVSFVEGPIDLFKTKMQIQIMRAKSGSTVQYRNVFHAGYVIATEYGIKGAYQGFSGTLLRNLPNNAIGLGIYEIVRDYYTPAGETVNDLSAWGMMVSGACTGVAYWIFTYPTDVIKSALMSDESPKSARKYKGLVHCIKSLYVNEGGWRRFYRGYSACLLRSIPANIALFLTLEKCRQIF